MAEAPPPYHPRSATCKMRAAVGQRALIKNLFELFLDLAGVGGPGHRQLLDDEPAGGVQHPPLAEREGLHPLETVEIAEHLGDLEQRPRLDLLHEAAVAPVPGLAVDVDLLVAQDLEDLLDLLLAGDPPQADLLGLVHRHQDSQPAVERAQHVEALNLAEDLFLLDPDDLGNTLRRVDGLVTNDELG